MYRFFYEKYMQKNARYRIAIAMAAILIISTLVIPAQAHLDKPGPPAIRVGIILNSVTLLQDQDDPFGVDDAEISILWGVTHYNHKAKMDVIEIPDFDWDAGPTRTLNKLLYIHDECTPLDTIRFDVGVVELDESILNDVIEITGNIIGAGVGAAVGIAVGSESGPGAIITAGVGAGIGAGIGASISKLAQNENDDLGKANLVTTKAGNYKITTAGADGGVTITYTVNVTEIEDEIGCNSYSLNVDKDPANQCDTVTATASTDSPNVKTVRFVWISPSGNILSGNDNSKPFTDSKQTCEPGQWTVTAIFSDGTTVEKTLMVGFMVLPESPIGAISMIGASIVGAFIYLRRRSTSAI